MNNLTLSDFYNFNLFTRDDGSVTPLIDISEGNKIGLIGYNAPSGLTDIEIKEDAYLYYNRLMEELK